MKYNNLDELFEAWKEEQNNESEWENTFPKKYEKGTPIIPTEDFKKSFCVDGFLSDKFNEVLFILKESNTCRDKPEGEYNDTFWFKENTKKEISGEKTDGSWNTYHTNMKWYLQEIFGEKINYYECAYMNLNKRGGYGECDDIQLSNYINKYRDLIKEQIKIINPKYVFCCGQGKISSVYELVHSIIKECVPDSQIYNCRHLSYRFGNKIYENK